MKILKKFNKEYIEFAQGQLNFVQAKQLLMSRRELFKKEFKVEETTKAYSSPKNKIIAEVPALITSNYRKEIMIKTNRFFSKTHLIYLINVAERLETQFLISILEFSSKLEMILNNYMS